MQPVTRNSIARHTILAERVPIGTGESTHMPTCSWCGQRRVTGRTRTLDPHPIVRYWLYRFHVDDDSGARHSGPIAGGRLFCSRACAEAYTDQPFV